VTIHILSDRRFPFSGSPLAAVPLPPRSGFVQCATDRNAQLRRCLAQMSREHHEVIDLVYYHDKSVEEVDEIIHLPKNTVKTRMFYARKRLARLLSTHQDFGHLQRVQAA
jgi:DNA-directed RNA polymerase specialized sigma24 family protein